MRRQAVELRKLTAAIKSQGIEPMPGALEARIRARLAEQEPVRLPLLRGRRVWAAAGALAVLLALMSGLLVNRRWPSTAREVVAYAERNAKRLASWHMKMRMISYDHGSEERRSYSEQWVKAPGMMRYEQPSHPGNGLRIEVTRRNSVMEVDTGSRIAWIMPPLSKDKVIAFQTSAIGYGFAFAHGRAPMRIVGATEVLGRACDVIEQQIGHYGRVQIALDRATGLSLRARVVFAGEQTESSSRSN